MPSSPVLNIGNVLITLASLPKYFDISLRKITCVTAEDNFKALAETISKIDKLSCVQKPSRSDKYLLEWNHFMNGKADTLSKPALNYLCWEPKVVEHYLFYDCISGSVNQLTTRALKGLMSTIHFSWTKESPEKQIVGFAAKQISAFKGKDRTINKWKTGISMLLGSRGAALFAKNVLLCELEHPKCASEKWVLQESSAYMRYAVFNAFDQSLNKMGRQREITDYVLNVLLDWDGWEINPSGFRAMVKQLILHPYVQLIVDSLQKKILAHPRLGDPRLPANINKWSGIDSSARQKFIGWLAKRDIVFFFDYVLSGEDRHRRRDFWLGFVNNDKLIASRAFLSEYTGLQIRRDEDINFGRLSAGFNRAAFVLHFGNIVVVEFSDVGKVYIYKINEFEDRVPDLWTTSPIRENRLKDQDLPDHRMIRHVNWEHKVSSALAKYGVRP